MLRTDESITFAGKEDLGRLTRRIGEFLVEIKKASWEYKQILGQHNKRHVQYHEFESTNYLIYAGKIVAMVAVLSVQIAVVRKIFD